MSHRIIRLSFLALLISFIIITISFAVTIQLPQTGQTTCYDSAGSEIACEGTGQDGEIRAGVAWPEPRFTPRTGSDSDCITDKLTGLMWPKNGTLVSHMNWYDAIDYANNVTLCGYSDWRLPNINEIYSLVNADVKDVAAWLNSVGFYNVQSRFYWSSTTSVSVDDGAWIVHLWLGEVSLGAKYDNNIYVLPVRSWKSGKIKVPKTGQKKRYRAGDDGDLKRGVAWPVLRLTDNGKGTVKDNLTGLIWLIDANCINTKYPSFDNDFVIGDGAVTWEHALDFVNGINNDTFPYCNGGYSDWRLPNIKELRSLIDYSTYDPAPPTGHPFINLYSHYNYWSSTTFAYFPNYAWIISMMDGYVDTDYPKDYNGYYVWPVRTGEVMPDLVITSLTFKPSEIIRGNTITLTAVTKNRGSGLSGNSVTNYYLSKNNLKNKKDILLSNNFVESLDISENTSATIDATIPADIRLGSYYIVACADDNRQVIERKEKNNCKASTKRVKITKK